MKREECSEFQRREYSIFIVAGGIANVIGFTANALLYGFNFPTIYCGICACLVWTVYFLERKFGDICNLVNMLMLFLALTEFPLLFFVYGRSMLPYMILSAVSMAFFLQRKQSIVVCSVILIYDIGAILISSFFSSELDREAEVSMLGPTICTFVIASATLYLMMTLLVGEYETRHNERDVLTGEFNRRGFVYKVHQILENSGDTEYAIVFLNLKGFKAINELFSQAGGDLLLKKIPEHLQKSFLEPEVIARLEGDHFVSLVRKDNVDTAKLPEFSRISFEHSGKVFDVICRCGIYRIADKKNDVGLMCDRAKMAEQYITDEYSCPYAFFTDEMARNYISKAELTDGAYGALKNEEFCVFYQPIFDLKTRRIASAEALVRWKHAQYGMVSPGQFVPVLEETGMISKVDFYVDTHVKRFLDERIRDNRPVVPVSVNLSRMDFYDREMLDGLLENIHRSELPKSVLRYEVTESAYTTLADSDNVTLQKLQEMGIKILLDDFGSGYSSFSTICDYPFDILKLDMGFIRKLEQDEKTRSIISSIIDMAHSIGMKTVAEGVETEQQIKFLELQECDYIQGYYFSKPLPQEEFAKLLDAQKTV